MLEHGGRLRKAALEYGIAEADWLDLSSGLAPWPFAVPDIPLRAWARLPETDDGLEQAACEYYGASQVLPVAGSQMAIQLLPRLRRAGKVGVLSPCYAEHAEAWRRSGYIVREVLEQEVDFFLDSLDVLVVVNPTGEAVEETLVVTDSKLMDATPLVDLLGTSSPAEREQVPPQALWQSQIQGLGTLLQQTRWLDQTGLRHHMDQTSGAALEGAAWVLGARSPQAFRHVDTRGDRITPGSPPARPDAPHAPVS